MLSQDAEQGIVECIVSVFGNQDYGGDVMVKGCFKESLARKYPKGVWMHDGATPVARTLAAKELAPNDPLLPDELKSFGGLFIRGQFNLDTQRGREAYSDIKFGIIDEFSIGFYPDSSSTEVKNKVRYIKKAMLVEWSPVLIGMNPLTAVLAVKSNGETMQTKGAYLGEHIEQRATVAACETVVNALFWRLYVTIYNDELELAAKQEQVVGMCSEAGALIAKIVNDILSSATPEEMETAGRALKQMFVPPAEVAPHTGVTLKTQVDLVHSANNSLIERLRAIGEWKAAARNGDKPLVLSEANRAHLAQQVATLKSAVEAGEALLAETTPEETAIHATVVSAAWLKSLAARVSLVE